MLFSEFPKLSQSDLDKVNLTPEAHEFYSDPNELKRLLIERAMYKKAYEKQQQNIDDVVSKIDSIMSQKVTQSMTLRDYAYSKYYENLFSKINSFKPRFQIEFNKNIKIEEDIYFIKNFILFS